MFRRGTLGRGAKFVDSPNMWLGRVSTAEGFVQAYVKLQPYNQFVAESVCAWFLRTIGVPTPEPFWIAVYKQVLPAYPSWDKNETMRVCFGTEALPA